MLRKLMDNYQQQADERQQAQDKAAYNFKTLAINQFILTLRSWFGDLYQELEWDEIEYEISRDQTFYNIAVSFKIPGLEFAECAVSNGKGKLKTLDSPPFIDFPTLAIKVPYNDGSNRDWWEHEAIPYKLVGIGDYVRLIGPDSNMQEEVQRKIIGLFVWAEKRNELSRQGMVARKADQDRQEYASSLHSLIRSAGNLDQLEQGYHKMIDLYSDHEKEFIQQYYERKEELIRMETHYREQEQAAKDYEEAEKLAIQKIKELWKPFLLYRISYFLGEACNDEEGITDWIYSLRPYSAPATGPGGGWWMQLSNGEIHKTKLMHVFKIEELLIQSSDEAPFGVLAPAHMTVTNNGQTASVNYKAPPDPDLNPINPYDC